MQTTVGGSVNCRRLIVKKRGFTQNGRTQCSSGAFGCTRRKNSMKKREGKKKHQNLVSRMITCGEGGAGFLHKTTKPTAWRGDVRVPEDLDGDAEPREDM